MMNSSKPIAIAGPVGSEPLRRRARADAVEGLPTVLFALPEEGCPTDSLLRAAALSHALGADLRVLRVLPKPSRVRALFPGRNSRRVVLSVGLSLYATRSARDWIQGALGPDESIVERFSIAHGEFVRKVAKRAAAFQTALIVVPPCRRAMGTTITSLANLTRIPVLVARRSTGATTVLAATDLQAEGYPVLKLAAALGVRIPAPLVIMHNVNPISVVPIAGLHGVRPVTLPTPDWTTRARASLLEAASHELHLNVTAVVRQDSNPVEAILGEARAREADMVVVGSRQRRWMNRLISGSIAARIVNRTKRSVLVTPIDDGLSPGP